MNIGTFTKSGHDLTGTISTFGAQFPEVTFRAIPQKGNSPDYIVEANGGELGAAWKKTSKDGETNYISVSFRSPFIPKEVYAALFENKDGTLRLVWDEPKKDNA